MGFYISILENSPKSSLTPLKIYLKNGQSDSLVIKEVKRVNKNDSLGSEGVKLTFSNKSGKIGEASISGIGTDMPFLYDFEVKESLRGLGYGAALLKYMIKTYKVNDLSVSPSNKGAIHLYRKLGFKDRFIYKDGKDKLLYMQIHKRGYENRD